MYDMIFLLYESNIYMNITVNIPDKILFQADHNALSLHIKRSEYIRNALEQMNHQVSKNARYARLQYLSQLVRDESAQVNSEFEAIDHDPKA